MAQSTTAAMTATAAAAIYTVIFFFVSARKWDRIQIAANEAEDESKDDVDDDGTSIYAARLIWQIYTLWSFRYSLQSDFVWHTNKESRGTVDTSEFITCESLALYSAQRVWHTILLFIIIIVWRVSSNGIKLMIAVASTDEQFLVYFAHRDLLLFDSRLQRHTFRGDAFGNLFFRPIVANSELRMAVR